MSLIPIRFHIRHISRLDSQQLVEVEKDAFPTLWPPTSFNREINNKLAVYLVAVALDDVSDIPYVTSEDPAPPTLLSRAVSVLRRLLPGTPAPGNDDYILGYLGSGTSLTMPMSSLSGSGRPSADTGSGRLSSYVQ